MKRSTNIRRSQLAAALVLLLLAVPAFAARPTPEVEREALQLLEDWRSAWEAGDIDKYITFYGEGFATRGMNRDAWRQYKARVFERSARIEVRVGNAEVDQRQGRVELRFDQQYKSNVYEDYGRKTLVLLRTDQGLRIVSELWKAYPLSRLTEEPLGPALEIKPVVAETWDEGLPEDHRAEGGETVGAVPPFEPVVTKDPGEVWVKEDDSESATAASRTRFRSPIPNRLTIVEEIVAKVNDAIITRTELEEREQEQPEFDEIQRSTSGVELQQALLDLRQMVLEDLINELLLLQRARDLGVDVESYVARYISDVKAESNIETDAELEELLEAEGMSLAQYKERIRRRKIPQRLVFEEVTSRVEVSDDEIRQWYDDNQNQFLEPERVVLREIVLLHDTDHPGKSAQLASEVHRLLVDGTDFEQLARRVSETPSGREGGYLGEFQREEMSDEIANIAFSLKEGEFSRPIETSHGFHIILLDQRIQESLTPFAEVRERIEQMLSDQRWNERLKEYLDDLYRTNNIVVNQNYQQAAARGDEVPADALEARR